MCLRQDKEGVNRDFFLEPIFPTVIFTSKLKLFSDKHFSSIFSPKQKAGGRRKKFKYWNVLERFETNMKVFCRIICENNSYFLYE